MIVNVASKCGLTPTNYKELNELYDEYGESKGKSSARFFFFFFIKKYQKLQSRERERKREV